MCLVGKASEARRGSDPSYKSHVRVNVCELLSMCVLGQGEELEVSSVALARLRYICAQTFAFPFLSHKGQLGHGVVSLP